MTGVQTCALPILKSEVGEILLITHLQGKRGCSTQIKLARKVLFDYSPRAMLLAALQGIADSFGIDEIEAVCATKQRSYKGEFSALFKNGYDDFFARAGMVKTPTGFYSSPIPIEGKPLATFMGRARSRAKKRRASREQIRMACASFLLGVADQAAASSLNASCSAPDPDGRGKTTQFHVSSQT